MRVIDTDYLVVGTGIAGLMSAIHLAPLGNVLILTKKDRADSNTNYAQGGIACVVDPEDSFEDHINDTLIAGAGLCDEAVVRRIVSEGPARIAELERFGLKFAVAPQENGGSYDLGQEGGHSKRRVLHCGDITGRRIEEILLDRALAQPTVSILEHAMVIDLITTARIEANGDNRVVGVYALDRRTGEIFAVRAPYVVMASGGGGKVYLYTSNPDIATGDGIAVAWRAGVPVKNMEMIQFHPTCLYHPAAKSFLISEAVRGEGAKLVDAKGIRFMEKYDARGELAPRDVVARAIDSEIKATGAQCAYLDIRDKPAKFVMERFPNIYETCKSYGIDITKNLIPVVPAAHYFCGGIEAGVDGVTALPGFFACGESACTGLHGANRLASNSLLEALVSAYAMSETVSGMPPAASIKREDVPDWEYGDAVPSDEAIVVEHNWNEVRTCMWDYVGIVRTDKRLERAARRLRNLREEVGQYYWDYLVTADILELRNIALVGELIVRSAQARKESRGLHFTLDYPELADRACSTRICDGVDSL